MHATALLNQRDAEFCEDVVILLPLLGESKTNGWEVKCVAVHYVVSHTDVKWLFTNTHVSCHIYNVSTVYLDVITSRHITAAGSRVSSQRGGESRPGRLFPSPKVNTRSPTLFLAFHKTTILFTHKKRWYESIDLSGAVSGSGQSG